jgi:hypothetical protein
MVLSGNPFVLSFSGSLLNDVIAGNLCLLGFATLLAYTHPATKTRTLILSFCLFGVAGLARYQNWSVAVAALAAIYVFDRAIAKETTRRSLRNTALGLGVLLLSVVAVSGAVRATFEIKSNMSALNLKYSLLYDMAAIAAASPDLPFRVFSNSGVDADMVRRRAIEEYTPYYHDPLGTVEGDQGTVYALVKNLDMGTIARQWWELVSAAPVDFLKSRIERFGIFLGLGRNYGCNPLDFLGLSRVRVDVWTALGKPGHEDAYATYLLRSRIFPAGTILFRPVTYLIASLVLIVLIVRKRTPEAPLVGGLILSAWLYWLTFVPLPIACSVRYSYYPCVAVIFALAAWYFANVRPAASRLVASSHVAG